MGVRNTGDENMVALFDSVSGIAFGPVFESAEDADDFVSWCAKTRGVEDLRVAAVSPALLRFARCAQSPLLDALFKAWNRERRGGRSMD